MAREDEIANHLQGLIGSTLQDVLGNNVTSTIISCVLDWIVIVNLNSCLNCNV